MRWSVQCLGKTASRCATMRCADSEGMTLVDGDTRQGTAYVSFERKHRIARYPFTPEKFGPPTGTVPLPAAAKGMVANRGIEAMALIKAGKLKGTLLAFAEGRADKNGNLIGWLIGGPTPGGILLKRIGGFDITDMAALPDGGVVVLERRFRFSEGIKMRLRRIAAGEIRTRGLDRRARYCSMPTTASTSTIWKRWPPTARHRARPC